MLAGILAGQQSAHNHHYVKLNITHGQDAVLIRLLSSLFAFNRLSTSIRHSAFCLFAIPLDEKRRTLSGVEIMQTALAPFTADRNNHPVCRGGALQQYATLLLRPVGTVVIRSHAAELRLRPEWLCRAFAEVEFVTDGTWLTIHWAARNFRIRFMLDSKSIQVNPSSSGLGCLWARRNCWSLA